jgi:hypothetical protein
MPWVWLECRISAFERTKILPASDPAATVDRHQVYRMFSAQADWTSTHTSHKHTRSFYTLDGVTLTHLLIRWSPNEWLSLCREIPVCGDKMFWTSNKPAKWTLYSSDNNKFRRSSVQYLVCFKQFRRINEYHRHVIGLSLYFPVNKIQSNAGHLKAQFTTRRLFHCVSTHYVPTPLTISDVNGYVMNLKLTRFYFQHTSKFHTAVANSNIHRTFLTFPAINPTWTELGSNPECRDENPATNRRSYVTRITLKWRASSYVPRLYQRIESWNTTACPRTYAYTHTRYISNRGMPSEIAMSVRR